MLSGANSSPILIGTSLWAEEYTDGTLTEYDAASGKTLQSLSIGSTVPHFVSPSIGPRPAALGYRQRRDGVARRLARYGGNVPGSFRYDGFDIVEASVICRYSIGDLQFVEQISFNSALDRSDPAVVAAARLIFLLAGVSYYKTSAPPVIDLGDHALTAAERGFLRDFYLQGLGEFAYRNELELDFEIRAREAAPEPANYQPRAGRPLVPFGGGIDSIVSVEQVRSRFDDVALFVSSPGGALFDAIEAPAALSGLPVVRATRTIDEKVLRSREFGFRNGHVPVTGILSAVAVLAAVSSGRDAVVMSNERSASEPTLVLADRSINHQYSKSWSFEQAFRGVLAESLGPQPAYFSLLRPYSELWVAERFAKLRDYHHVFRSCNRAFHIDPAARLDHWCGHCDKCCFIDLVLAPFLTPDELGGHLRWDGTAAQRGARRPVPGVARHAAGSQTLRVRGRYRRMPGGDGADGSPRRPRARQPGAAAGLANSRQRRAERRHPQPTHEGRPHRTRSPMRTRPNLSWSDLRGARVGVWGLGVEGHANLRRLQAIDAVPVLVDDDPAAGSGAVRTDEGGLEALRSCEVVVKTPGISRYRTEVERAGSGRHPGGRWPRPLDAGGRP